MQTVGEERVVSYLCSSPLPPTPIKDNLFTHLEPLYLRVRDLHGASPQLDHIIPSPTHYTRVGSGLAGGRRVEM